MRERACPDAVGSVYDLGWGEFRQMLECKTKWYGRRLTIPPRYFPSSKTCSVYGYVQKLSNEGVRVTLDVNHGLADGVVPVETYKPKGEATVKVRYVGQTFGVDSLTDGKIYEVIGVEYGMLRIIDDSGEDYLYSAKKPGTISGEFKGGKFEVVEDDEDGTLEEAIS